LPISNNIGLKKVGEMDLASATNHFFALEEDPASPMLELTHNHDQTEPYDKGNGSPMSPSPSTTWKARSRISRARA
jgi:hypothetical protein